MSTNWSFARQTLKNYLPSVTMPSVPSAPMKLCARWEDGGQRSQETTGLPKESE